MTLSNYFSYEVSYDIISIDEYTQALHSIFSFGKGHFCVLEHWIKKGTTAKAQGTTAITVGVFGYIATPVHCVPLLCTTILTVL